MTLQEIFNKAYLGLAGQKFEKSVDARNRPRCQYRGIEGRKCAIGHLISDENYTPDLECRGVFSWSVNQALNASGVVVVRPSEEERLLDECQQAHDNSTGPEDMRLLLKNVAAAHNLTVPEMP